MDFDPFWLLVVVGVLVSFGVSGYQKMQARTAREDWAKAAKQLDLTLGSSGHRGLSMEGTEGKLQVQVEVRKSSDSIMTQYRVAFPPLGIGLRLSRESGWQGFVKALGGEDIEVGDAMFDGRFVVKANSVEGARRYFTPQRISALNALFDRHPDFAFSNDELKLDVKGMTTDGDEIVATVKDLLVAARTLQPDVDAGMLSDDAFVAAAIDSEDTRDQALQKVYDTLDARVEEEAPEPVQPSVVIDAAAAPVVANHDGLGVGTALFGDNKLSFEVDRLFAAEYVGSGVDWSGVSKGAAGVRAGNILDDDTDAILEVDLGSIEDDLIGSSTIEAAVALPNGTTLPDRGQPVRFTGTLHAVDGLTKTLFVADGLLV